MPSGVKVGVSTTKGQYAYGVNVIPGGMFKLLEDK